MVAKTAYPPRHREAVFRAWRVLGLVGVCAGIPALGLSVYAATGGGTPLLAAIVSAVFILLLVGAAVGVWDCSRHVRVVPYFERQVDGIDTFLHGVAVARYLSSLDELSVQRGEAPLSSFGFEDDFRGEAVVWHLPAAGLQTVESLIQILEAQPEQVPESEAVLDDLMRIAEALRHARELEIRFSMLLLHGSSTSPMEWEQRLGSPF